MFLSPSLNGAVSRQGFELAHRRALLAAGTLSLLLHSPIGASATMSTGSTADIPSNVQTIIKDVLRIYVATDGKEQGDLVKLHYREDAHFIDPLMDVKGPEEVALAFRSLPKIFKLVEVSDKGNTKAVPLPKELQTDNLQAFDIHNQQNYHFAKSGFLGKMIFPDVVELDVTTTLVIDPQSGKVVKHQDVWNNKGFGLFGFMKRPNGALGGAVFKALGWKKELGMAS